MRLAVTTLGEGDGGPRIALVHGLGGDAATWRPFAAEVEQRSPGATVLAPDLRGHGRSDRAPSYGIADFADDLVETLPAGLDLVVGHSLGGTVLAAAVERLAPRRALYLDPGFALSLPTTGAAGRLFWATAPVSLAVAALVTSRASRRVRALYPDETRRLLDEAGRRFDRRMAGGVFREVAFHPVAVAAPVVPSTIVLSGDDAAVLPSAVADRLAGVGWDVRRLPGLRHDMHLEDPAATADAVRDLLER